MTEKTLREYDEMAYPSLLHPQTHPDRLATMAILLGLKPKTIKNCRVLELGCGNGTNSIAFAYSLPESEFIGIDLSEKQIADGNSIIRSVGLENLRLIHADILDLSGADELGKFDYIIAHGFYSWTPDNVRNKSLAICRETLNENGIAFVSYNTLPGFHLRKMMRKMMLFHTGNEENPQKKVEKGMWFLNFLGESVGTGEVFGKILKKEFELMKRNPLGVIFHDDLEDVNKPVYFHEFIEHAGRHGLQFVSEVEYFTMKDAGYSPKVREFLQKFGEKRLQREQYIDFWRNRRFRQTLLCHQELEVSNRPQAQFLRSLRFSADLQTHSENCDLAPNKIEDFIGKKDNRFQIDHALTKAALVCLGEIFPRSISYGKLVKKATELLKKTVAPDLEINDVDEQILSEVLLQIYGVGLANFSAYEPQFVDSPGENPLASKLAVWQIQKGFPEVVTLRFENLKIEDAFARKLLVLCDGTRNVEDLRSELENDPELKFESEDKRQEFLNDLTALIQENLNKLASFGLFVN